jgi:hypothetical protein
MSWGAPQVAMLPDGARLHLHHGPIDLIVWADPGGRAAAFSAAVARFRVVLEELVAELPLLRSAAPVQVQEAVAWRMAAAVAPFAAMAGPLLPSDPLTPSLPPVRAEGGAFPVGAAPGTARPESPTFITPMAAVAGAVADEVLAAMTAAVPLTKAWVNNGGDIAFHLTGDATMTALMAGGRATIRAGDPVRGIATSGWQGRSQSLGIADAVTVLAATGAMADAAATMIANAVDLPPDHPGHPAVTRRPAVEVKADSDLGHRLVTVGVAPLPPADRALALSRGLAAARAYARAGLIHAAHLTLQGETRATEPLPTPEPAHA